jgi:hypothetical protein
MVRVSSHARAWLDQICAEKGPRAILLTTACTGISPVALRILRDFEAAPTDVLVGVVATCRVYADLRHVALCPHDVLYLDLHWQSGMDTPTIVARPESTAEQQQRIFSAQARGQTATPPASR